jgi:hypothetical protein
VSAAIKLLSAPLTTWQPIDIAETIFGFLCFVFVSWTGLRDRYTIAPRRSGAVSRSKLPNFFHRRRGRIRYSHRAGFRRRHCRHAQTSSPLIHALMANGADDRPSR